MRDEAKIDRRTAGVTGIRLEDFGGGYCPPLADAFGPPRRALEGVIVVEDEEAVE